MYSGNYSIKIEIFYTPPLGYYLELMINDIGFKGISMLI